MKTIIDTMLAICKVIRGCGTSSSRGRFLTGQSFPPPLSRGVSWRVIRRVYGASADVVDVDEEHAEQRSLNDEAADTVEIDFLKVPTSLQRMFARKQKEPRGGRGGSGGRMLVEGKYARN